MRATVSPSITPASSREVDEGTRLAAHQANQRSLRARPRQVRRSDPAAGRVVRHRGLSPDPPQPILGLPIGVVEPALVARLVASVRGATAPQTSRGPTPRPTVAVSPVARPAHRKGRPAPGTREQVQDHPGQSLAHRVPRVRGGQAAALMGSSPQHLRFPQREARLSHLPRPGCNPPGRRFCGREDTAFRPDAPSARTMMPLSAYLGRLLVRNPRFLVTADRAPPRTRGSPHVRQSPHARHRGSPAHAGIAP